MSVVARLLAGVIALAALAGFGDSAQAQAEKCIGNPGIDYDIQIGSCTSAIRSGRWSGKGLSWAFNNRGMAYSAKGEYDRAIVDYEQAMKLDPKDALAVNNLANAYYRKGEYARAIPYYDRALRLNPNFAIAKKNRASAIEMRDKQN